MSTGARFELLKYNLLSKVDSTRAVVGILGIRLRKSRKTPSPTTAITINTIATVMPAEPCVASLTTRAKEEKDF